MISKIDKSLWIGSLLCLLPIVFGLIFILRSNYFPKNRVNPNVGMKFPWLFHDEEGWTKTHKLSGSLWIIAGFILILSSFGRIPFMLIFTVFITLITLIPIIYSLYLYKMKRKSY